MKKEVILIGGGGHASSCYDLVTALGHSVIGVLSPHPPSAAILCGLPHWTQLREIPKWIDSSYCLAVGDNYIRHKIYQTELSHCLPPDKFPPFCHPACCISSSAFIGRGATIFAGAVVGANAKIADFCILNTLSSLDHDSEMHPFSSLAPGVHVGGSASIGARTSLCIGVSVSHGIKIGKDVVVGAGAVVLKDIPPNALAYGIPAVVQKKRLSSDPYLH